MAVQATEPAPYSGDLRIKIRWTSNDYDRVHQLFIMKVDARGQVIYNLTIQAVTKDGAKTYFWAPVDPEDYQYQLTPLLEIEQGMANQLYQSLLEHLIHKGHMAPPSTTEAEDVERKMLMSENAFLKELVTTLAGTRKDESWDTTSTRTPTSELQRSRKSWSRGSDPGSGLGRRLYLRGVAALAKARKDFIQDPKGFQPRAVPLAQGASQAEVSLMTQSGGPSSIRQSSGKGIVTITADHDTGMAIAALLSSLTSDGTISIYSEPHMDRSAFQIDIHGQRRGEHDSHGRPWPI